MLFAVTEIELQGLSRIITTLECLEECLLAEAIHVTELLGLWLVEVLKG